PSEPADRSVDRALPVGLAGHVEGHEDGLAALGPDLGLDLPALRFEHVYDDNPGAFLDEEPRLHRAHAARAAADQGGFPGEPHRGPPDSPVGPGNLFAARQSRMRNSMRRY